MIIQSKPALLIILEAILPKLENGKALLELSPNCKVLQEKVKLLEEIKNQAINELSRMEIEVP